MSHKTDTAWKRTNQPTKTGWELFEMTPDGKLLRDQSTINVDVSALSPPCRLIRLPRQAARSRRIRPIGSGTMSARQQEPVGQPAARGPHPVVAVRHRVTEHLRARRRLVIDTSAVAAAAREGWSADSANKNESKGSIRLDSGEKSSTSQAYSRGSRGVIGYFDVKKAYEEEGAKSDPDDTTGAADKRALALLQDALRRAQDSTVIGLLKDDIKQEEQSANTSFPKVREPIASGGQTGSPRGNSPTLRARTLADRLSGQGARATGGTRAARGASSQCRL